MEFLHYVDVNSLYPKAMLNYMPLELLEVITNKIALSRLDLDNFFGFLKVEVHCPPSLKRPVLPCKFEGKTIFPTGTWTATYFSEEIKAVLKLDLEHNLGYKFTVIEAHSYTKEYLFNRFIYHFYEIKKNAVGPAKFLAKLCLNSLYGMFGRKIEINETLVVDSRTLLTLSTTRIINSVITIKKDLFLVSVSSNVNTETLSGLNSMLKTDLGSKKQQINSNVAIASAVTAYARIHMMPFKLLDCVVYSDTDSFFTTDLRPFLDMISDELGDFKDELKGLVINKAIFLGIKQYGFQYFDVHGKLIDKSVFAGIKRDSLTFEQIVKLFQGEALNIDNGDRFFRSMSKLNIQIKPSVVTIKQNTNKKLVGPAGK